MVNWLLSAFRVAVAVAPEAVPTAPLLTVIVGARTKVLPAGSTALAANTMGAADSVAAPSTAAMAPLGVARAAPGVWAEMTIWLPTSAASIAALACRAACSCATVLMPVRLGVGVLPPTVKFKLATCAACALVRVRVRVWLTPCETL